MNVSEKRKLLIKELLQGKEYATQLKFLLKNKNPNGNGSDGSLSVKELMTNVLRSFSETISVMSSSEGCSCDDVVNNLGEDGSSNDLRSEHEDSSEISKKKLLPNTKDRRGSYKRRKTEETRIIVSQTTDDIHAWRKYGQKEILNSQFPRSYFRCTRKHEQGCKATKQVQRIQENPDMFQITYIGFHTCKDIQKTPQMVTFSDTNANWDSFLVNSHPHSKEVLNYDQQNSLTISSERLIVKQECPNNDESTTQKSDLTDNFDPNLWSDFKDFELSKPAAILSFNNVASDNIADNDFGVFSSDFSNDLVYFDKIPLL